MIPLWVYLTVFEMASFASMDNFKVQGASRFNNGLSNRFAWKVFLNNCAREGVGG